MAQEKFDLIVRARDEASATIRGINTEVNKMAGTALPRLTTGLGTYERAALKADIRSAALGASIAGLPAGIGQMTNALAFGNPVIAAASFLIGVLTTEIIQSIRAHEDAQKAIIGHRKELDDLANSNDKYAQSARTVLGLRRQSAIAELKEAEGKLALAQAGIREAKWFELLVSPLSRIKSLAGDQQVRAVAELLSEISRLKKELGELNGEMFGPPEPPKISNALGSIEDAAKKAREELNRFFSLWDKNIDAGVEKKEMEFQKRLRDERDNRFRDLAEGPTSDWAQHDEEVKNSIQSAEDKWQEFSGVVMSSTDQLATGITDMFFGLRDNLSEVFQSMAQSWVKYFINEILKQTALRLGFILFNAIFPGAGGLVATAGAVATGGGNLDEVGSPKRSGIDLAAPRRYAGGGAGKASVTVNIDTVIGTEEFVGKRIIPAIENAIRFQKTSIAGR